MRNLLVVFVVGYDVFVEVDVVAAFGYDEGEGVVELGRGKELEVVVEVEIGEDVPHLGQVFRLLGCSGLELASFFFVGCSE